MSTIDGFMIGSTLLGLQSFAEIGIDYDPAASYRPFSVVDRMGDLSGEGNGFPMVEWHFNIMGPGDADILYDYLDGNISAPIFIRTRLNRLNGTNDDYLWATFSGFMNWMPAEEQNPAYHTMDVTITFTGLVLIPDYP